MKFYYAITPTAKSGFASGYTRYFNEGDFERVREAILLLTDSMETAINVSSWCELAGVGEKYEHEMFTVEIIEDVE